MLATNEHIRKALFQSIWDRENVGYFLSGRECPACGFSRTMEHSNIEVGDVEFEVLGCDRCETVVDMAVKGTEVDDV